MNYNDLAIFNVMRGKMQYLSQRQAMIAQNIANADTPNYRAKDVKAPDFKRMAMGITNQKSSANSPLKPTLTDPKHMAGIGGLGGHGQVYTRKNTDELNPNGNNVSIEEETMLLGSNQAEYNKVLGLYRKTVDMFKTAIGKSGA
jgi:flagellar basal-body rod protein FlgB